MSMPDGLDVLLICIICALLDVIIQSGSQMLFSVFQIIFFFHKLWDSGGVVTASRNIYLFSN